MKNYFLKLFDYDQFENQVILKLIFEANQPDTAVQLMAHLLAAQQVWLNRCKGLPAIAVVLWPDWQADMFEKTINDNYDAWKEFLNGLNPEDFEKIISYKNSKGDSFENKLTDILAHVINHGTHHRAQVGQQLKAAGIESLPYTDYVFYLRQTK